MADPSGRPGSSIGRPDLLVATDVGGPSFSLATVHGLWVSTLYESLLVVFALAASVPQRTPVNVTTSDRMVAPAR